MITNRPLQRRYEVQRRGKDCFVLREGLTEAERFALIEQMTRTGSDILDHAETLLTESRVLFPNSKYLHSQEAEADALIKYRDERVRQGKLQPPAK